MDSYSSKPKKMSKSHSYQMSSYDEQVSIDLKKQLLSKVNQPSINSQSMANISNILFEYDEDIED